MNVKRLAIIAVAMLAVTACIGLANAQASVTSLTAYPGMVPNDGEQLPRGILGEYPIAGDYDWGTSCWQGPESGKSNFHVRQNADGNYFNYLFGDDPVLVSDLVSLSYWTMRDSSIAAGKDWWMTIYTFPEDGDSKWYHSRIHGNYGSHAVGDGLWHEWNTDDNSLKFGNYASLDALKAAIGDERIMSITIQTDSGWNGFDGYVDGITIELSGDRVGRVNLQAVPEPATILVWTLLGAASWLGMGVCRRGRLILRKGWPEGNRAAILDIIERGRS